MNTQCDHYTLVESVEYRPNWHCLGGYEEIKVQKGYCRGTKEYEQCFCKGNPYNCDFYSDVRKTANEKSIEHRIKKSIKFLQEHGYKVIKK